MIKKLMSIMAMLLISICMSFGQMYQKPDSVVLRENVSYVIPYDFTNTGTYTFKAEIQSNRLTDYKRGAGIYNYGSDGFGIAYPNMTVMVKDDRCTDNFNTLPYQLLKDGNFHTLTVVITPNIREVYVDNYKVLSSTGPNNAAKTARFVLNANADFDNFDGIIRNIRLYNTAVPPTEAYIPKGLDPLDHPIGYIVGTQNYTSVKPVSVLLQSFPNTQFRPGSKLPWNYEFFNRRYLVDDKNVDTVMKITRIMLPKYHIGNRVIDNIPAAYEDLYVHPAPNEIRLYDSLYAYGLQHPEMPMQITDAWAHYDPINGTKLNNLANATPDSPLSYFDGYRTVNSLYAEGIYARYPKIQELLIDNETMNQYVNWPDQIYAGNKYADQALYIQQPFRTKFAATLRLATEYDISGCDGMQIAPFFAPRIRIATDGLGTINMYTRQPRLWSTHEGPQRGIDLYVVSKRNEILAGHPWNAYCPSAGWSTAENNLTTGQYLGMNKVVWNMGVLYAHPGYFIEGAVYNPKGYVGNLVVPSMIQAVYSQIDSLFLNSNLLEGDVPTGWYTSGQPYKWAYMFLGNSKEMPTTIRKAGTNYIIASSYMNLDNYINSKKTNVNEIQLRDNGYSPTGPILRFNVRRQGTVAVWNSTNLTYYEVDGWHDWTSLDRWSQDIQWEAEINKTGLVSEGINTIWKGLMPIGYDLTNVTTYTTQANLTYSFNVNRPGNQIVWARLKGVNSALIYKGASINVTSDDWYWYKVATVPATDTLSLTFLNTTKFDKMYITTDTAITFPAAPPVICENVDSIVVLPWWRRVDLSWRGTATTQVEIQIADSATNALVKDSIVTGTVVLFKNTKIVLFTGTTYKWRIKKFCPLGNSEYTPWAYFTTRGKKGVPLNRGEE